jgi:hypothetical protein
MYNIGMEDLIINIYSYAFEELNDHGDELRRLSGGRGSYEYSNFEDFDSLATESLSTPNNFYLFNIRNKNEFILVTKFLKQLQKEEVLFKGMCFFDFDNPKAENILSKHGLSNILKNNTTVKNFSIKTSMHLRALAQNIKEAGSNLKFKDMRKQSPSKENEEKIIKKNIGLVSIKKKPFINRYVKTNNIQLGEVSPYPPQEILAKSKFKAAIDPGKNPKFLDYIGKLGDAGKLNIENGELAINSSLGDNLECVFDGFFDDEITLDITGHIEASVEDPVSLFVKFIYEKFKVEIELDGVIKEIERYATNSRYITLKLDESCEVQREHFMSIYEKRQKSIDKFMELAKGIA